MMAPTHLVTAGMIAYKVMGLKWKMLIISIIASVIPDIDHPDSFLGRLFFFVSIPINTILGHRTITHSFLGLATTSYTAYFISGDISVLTAWVIGYGSHIILDLLTPMGAPIFWPYSKNFGLSFVNGTVAEFIYMIAFIFYTAKYIF